jgi:ATP-dependent DNA ligase
MVRLPVKSIIIDGEAVCLLEEGRPDFHALR